MNISQIPPVSDWEVITHENSVFVESSTIANTLNHFDDAWLGVSGNMLHEEKRALADYIVTRLNNYENLKIECETFRHGYRLMSERCNDLEREIIKLRSGR